MISGNKVIEAGGELHTQLLAALVERKKASETEMAGRWDKWREADEQAVGYLKASDADKARKDKKKDTGISDYVAIEIPYSYGMMMSAHTYHSSVFLGRDPIQQFTARHGEPQSRVLGVEALMGYQLQVGGHRVPYYIWLYDALKYGIGIVFNHWADEKVTVSNIVTVPEVLYGVETGKTKRQRKTETIQGYQGNRLFNVRPYDYLPDPRVPLMYPQKGEFVGRLFDISWNDVVEGMESGRYFNKTAAETAMALKAKEEHGSSAVAWPKDRDTLLSTKDLGYGRGCELIIRLIPSVWKLGAGNLPEKWVFTLLNDRVIIGCRPFGEYHDKFPVSVLEPEIEGYQLHKAGMLEQMQGMNDVLTWLFNSHFYNIRAALNNQFVYDPSKIHTPDLFSNEPGLTIRLKPEGYGTDVRQAIRQFPVQDVTSSHMQNFGAVGELMQRAFGVTDPVMGVPSQKNRQTAQETRQNAGFSVNRLKTEAEYMSAMGWGPLAEMMLQSTQQHYDQEKKYRILGDLVKDDPFQNVTPEDIQGFYDFVAVDGTLPVDRFAQANLWKEIMVGLRQMPDVGGAYDFGAMFGWMAQLAGLRNINQFKIQASDPEVIEKEVDKGNLVAMGQAAERGIPPQLAAVAALGGPNGGSGTTGGGA